MNRTKISLALLLLASVAWADSQNKLGTAGAPVSVTTTTKVLAGNLYRKTYCIIPEGVDIRCFTGNTSDGAPPVAPTTTKGFLVKSNTYFCYNQSPGANNIVSPELRLDCASVGAAVGVSTWESP